MLSPGSRRRALAVILASLTGAALAGGPWSARAQTAPGLPIGSTTTTTARSSSTTSSSTTTTAAPSTTTTEPGSPLDLGPGTSTTTTTTAPPGGGKGKNPPPSDGGGGAAPPASPQPGDGGSPPADAGPFPPELQALMNSVRRTPPNNTKKLLFALSPLQSIGMSETQEAIVGFGRFPVAGLASYSHDWWFPRFGPGWRLHQGTDIFAAFGTPVRAPVDGRVKINEGGFGGLAVYVVQPDGTFWYLAHLSAVPDGLADGMAVKTGDVIGFVGDSGNALGSPPHVHLEIHPGGGGAIDPKPVLDQFIADALALAPKVVDAYLSARRAGAAPKVAAAPAPRVVAAALPPRAALLWTTAVSPAGGAVHLAEAEAARVASSIDWSTRDEKDGEVTFDRRLARQYAAWWMEPLVHPLLARYLT